ncbi:MAG: hypothetical protein ACFCU7_09060 [Pleurocapsa sp.]
MLEQGIIRIKLPPEAVKPGFAVLSSRFCLRRRRSIVHSDDDWQNYF